MIKIECILHALKMCKMRNANVMIKEWLLDIKMSSGRKKTETELKFINQLRNLEQNMRKNIFLSCIKMH